MPEKHPIPVVPLEAGRGPDNPPCPACGEPLFGWIDRRPGLAGAVRRCESCGLAVVGEPGGADDALAELERVAGGEAAIPNRAGLAAWLGGAGWAGLEPGARFLFTPDAARRLMARRDRLAVSQRWAPGASLALMWQTVVNGFTFGKNVALGAAGRSRPVPARRRWQRALDAVVVVLISLPALLVAAPLEAGAAALGRGGALRIEFRPR